MFYSFNPVIRHVYLLHIPRSMFYSFNSAVHHVYLLPIPRSKPSNVLFLILKYKLVRLTAHAEAQSINKKLSNTHMKLNPTRRAPKGGGVFRVQTPPKFS
uniref:Uncharacterized protein n=1 Tax=Cacopsylla melanoneura TaxID=428564 RepID=A0A8D8W511_9HEMI